MSKDDEFIKKYLEISEKVSKTEGLNKINFGIFRNDFMIDSLKKFIFQIEINTIASSLGNFSDQIKKFYNHFKNKYPDIYNKYIPGDYEVPSDKEDIIENISDTMITAIKLLNLDYKQSIIVFVVQEKERNIFDQRSIESKLWDK